MESIVSISRNIQSRFSCRTYQDRSIDAKSQASLTKYIAENTTGPFGNKARFTVIIATETDRKALKGLGTYGFIKNTPGFIIGAIQNIDYGLEDFGYLMEKIILHATDLNLGTCWLGGTFTKSTFAQKMSLQDNEIIPAVSAVGYISGAPRKIYEVIRQVAHSDRRYPWINLFFDTEFGIPLTRENAGNYSTALEMVRLGPSASNQQPWRIIKDGKIFHFYLQRKQGYRDNKYLKILRAVDLQRIDLGIAMCHFELTVSAFKMIGNWKILETLKKTPDQNTEYLVSWVDHSIS